MPDFRVDRDAAAEIKEKIEADLRIAMDGAASVSEFRVVIFSKETADEILSLRDDSYRLKNHNLGARLAEQPID